MDEFGRLFHIIIAVVFVNNFVLKQFLGLCPFIGVSKKTDAAFGMGMAVTFVMALASAVTWLLYTFVLTNEALIKLLPGMPPDCLVSVLKVSAYILVIASLVQLVEMFLRKAVPALYRSLGIYLPLITTNCAVLGVAFLNTTNAPTRLAFHEAVIQGAFAGVGFTIAMLLMSGIRERLELLDVPEALKGAPIAFISTGLMALAFFGFSGMA